MTEFGWVFFSKEHKETANTIIKMMSQEGMVDELGIGAIRDAFANALFPGISTVQTRAKYFFIVPYLLYDYQRDYINKGTTKSITKYLDDAEQQVKKQLTIKYKPQDDLERGSTGVIGISLNPNKPIVRRPSSIYWGGLNAYKLINSGGLGVDAFLNNAYGKSKYSTFSEILVGDGENSDDIENNYDDKLKLHKSICPSPNWKEDIDINLSKEEADILNDLILKHQPNSLLAYILTNKKSQEAMNASENFNQFANLAIKLDLPNELIVQIILANDFSEIMLGSNLAYNYWLQFEKYGSNTFEEEYNKWHGELSTNMLSYSNFSIDSILTSDFAKTTKDRTKVFIKNWWHIANSKSNIYATELLIKNQEAFNKKAKARIKNKRWDDVFKNKQIGLGQLNYRFIQAKRIINDILKAKQ